VDANNIGLPDYSVDVVLARHIPDTLPIRGKRVKVTYPGIPILCNRCWKLGHGHWECKEPNKTNWLELVADFYGNEKVTDEMLGSWLDALYKYHPLIRDPPPTADLRSAIPVRNTQPSDARQMIRGEPPMRFEQARPQRLGEYQQRFEPQPQYFGPPIREFRDQRPRGRGGWQAGRQDRQQDRRQFRDTQRFDQGDFYATSYQRAPRDFRDRHQ
jgi:hypothetical protein